ncbi:MAG: phosphoribosylformylglycinamidine cyclo-ligase, partial [Clostridiaceae bacterium]|nr:phosphoribosylformylglycinamidine cyclo-ligase [Clostridiaceae bacterium]
MGIGMVIAVNREDAEDVLDYLHQIGETAYIIGDVAYGDNGVEII